MAYYPKKEIDDILKCAFCKIKFFDVVKLIPDCGNSICGYCYHEGKTLVNSHTQFKCRICDEEHSLPHKGFPDNKILLNLLQNDAKERPLSREAKALKSSVEELNEKMKKLELFDQSIEINSHCGQLELDVSTAAESAIQFIRKLESSLIIEIDQYRTNLLGSKFVDTRRYLEDLSNEVYSFSDQWKHYFGNIDALRTDAEIEQAHKIINEFTLRIANSEKQLRNKLFNGFIMIFEANDSFNKNTELIGRHLFHECIADETFIQDTFEGYEIEPGRPNISRQPTSVTSELSNKQSVDSPTFSVAAAEWNIPNAYQSEVVVPKQMTPVVYRTTETHSIKNVSVEDDAQIESKSFFSYGDSSDGADDLISDLLGSRNSTLSTTTGSHEMTPENKYEMELLHVLSGHSGTVYQALFLPAGRIATCSLAKKICVWNIETGNSVFKLSTPSCTYAMALLSNNRLATGSYDNFIHIWDLNDNHKQITKLSSHKRSVVALRTISNERLVSYSYDDTVKIWNTLANNFSLILTINGHGNSRSWLNNKLYPYFSILSNQNIVTCSSDSKTNCELKLWDSNHGKLIESIVTPTKEISTMFVLRNDQVILCGKDMSVWLFDFYSQVKSKKLRISLNERIYSIAQLYNGDLVSSGSSLNDFLTVWNLNSSKAIQNIYVGHSKKIHTLSLSDDQTFLATCSDDSTVKIFRLREVSSSM